MTRKIPHIILTIFLSAAAAAAQEQSVYLSLEGAPASALEAAAPAAGQFAIKQRDAALKMPQTLGETLELDPEVSLRRGGAPGLMELAGLRGFASKNTAVMFNGKRLAPDVTGTTDLSLLNPAGADKIQVFGGAVSPLYGANAEGGVINIVPAGAAGPAGASASGMAADFGTGAAYVRVRGGAGPLRAAVSGGRRYSGGFQQNGWYSGADMSAQAVLAGRETGAFSLEAAGSSQTNGIPGGTPVPIAEWDGKKERQANSLTDRQSAARSLLAAGYSSPEGAPVSLRAEAWTSQYDICAWQYGGANRTKTSLNSGRLTAAFSRRSALMIQYEDSSLEDSSGYGNHSITSKSAAAETRLDLARNLELAAGARLESPNRWADQLSPRAMLVWRPAAGWKLSLSAVRAWQAPTFADMYNPWAPANPGLKPEHSWQYDAGAQWETLSGWAAKASVYYSAIADKIALDPNNGYAAYNLDEGRILGFQPQLVWKNAASRHVLSCALLRSEVRPAGLQWKTANFAPSARATYSGEFYLPLSLTLGVFLRHAGKQYTDLGRTGVRLPAFTTADITLRRETGAVSVSVSAQNISDEHYAENADSFNGYYPMPGRAFRAALSVFL
ncbi:MAG: TonB-dependent receptor [Elusimicrobiales bacterium]